MRKELDERTHKVHHRRTTVDHANIFAQNTDNDEITKETPHEHNSEIQGPVNNGNSGVSTTRKDETSSIYW